MKAKILVQSDKVDTYVNVMAAMCEKYTIEHVMLSFIEREPDDSFVKSLQEKLVSLSEDSCYTKAARVRLETEKSEIDFSSLVNGWNVVDVTGVNKELAINISAASIGSNRIHVCQLTWHHTFETGEAWLLKEDNHKYSDLMGAGALSNLYQEHFKKRHVIIAFGLLFSVVLAVSIIKIFVPSFVVPEDLVNLFSLMIGASGLYLAIMSLRGNLHNK
jgi:hypothetical protein